MPMPALVRSRMGIRLAGGGDGCPAAAELPSFADINAKSVGHVRVRSRVGGNQCSEQ